MHYEYTPHKTCSRKLRFDIDFDDGGLLHNISFDGGCDGNLKALGTLLEGQTAEFAIARLKGIDCDSRGTSCGDQLAKAIEEAIGQQRGKT
jgi:uncharacterized protein (TIGR03905 family)